MIKEPSFKQPITVKEYLQNLKWDGKERLASWGERYLGCKDPEQIRFAEGWLTNAVLRPLHPGIDTRHTFVLAGRQGCGKSRALNILGADAYMNTCLHELNSKNNSTFIERWIIEISELPSYYFSKSQSGWSLIKQFLFRQTDKVRELYTHDTALYLRRNIFIISTNLLLDLEDLPSRMLVIQCGSIDLAALAKDRDQLFAEVMAQRIRHPLIQDYII